ncbi:MAG: competence/damage-inducible protein A [Tissierellia bacterium]|nr:competence/damage-inducible protein A [Tissierellia bacterium]
MKAEIITIGTEILIGSIINTNSKYLANKLSEIGVEVLRQVTINDAIQDITDELKIAVEKCDIVFVCGGLGPTEDDVTREAVAKFVGMPLIYDEEEKKNLIDASEKMGRILSPNNLKQVQLIKGSTKLKNHWGSALGEYVQFKKSKIFLLPGPPKEFEPMVDHYIAKAIDTDQNILIKSVNVIGLGESNVELILRKLHLENDNISINTFAHYTQTEIKLIAKGDQRSDLNKLMNDRIEKLYETFSGHIYSEDNASVEEVLIRRLIETGQTISIAESITGGLIAGELTNVSGASQVLHSSFVTYSNGSKEKHLGVNHSTLEDFGAISKQTALEMAKGLLEKEQVDIAVATTGEAGPIPSETEVGNVYACIYFADGTYDIKHYFFPGNRNKIRSRTVNSVLSNLLYLVNKRRRK